MRLVAATFFGLGLFACGVSLKNETFGEITINSCEESSECSGGSCRGGICQKDRTDIPALLLSVTPPSGVPTIAGIGLSTVVSEFEPGPYGYEVTLGSLAYIEGIASGFELSDERCLPDVDNPTASPSRDDSIPVRVTLTPRERLIGLPATVHTADVDAPLGGAYKFNMVVPAGRYDVYFEPLATADGCVRPPYLVVDQEFSAGGVTLTLDLPSPEPLLVKIRYPQITDDLNGFLVDIVERDSGRLLSNRVRLQAPSETDEGLEYSAELAFSQVEGDQAAPATELIRMSPPEGIVAPTLFVERSVVDLFQDGEGLIDQLTDLPDPVKFSARIALDGEPTGAPSTVLLVATGLKSTAPGTVASFSRLVETDEQGFFEVDLLPGTYQMSVEPLDRTRARTEVELTVSDSSEIQGGKTVEVEKRDHLEGRVVSFNGVRVAGAPIWAGPVPASTRGTLLEEALGLLRPLPTSVSTTSDSSGEFSMLADPGLFNIAARPEAASGFPWRIRLGVDTREGDVSVGRLQLSLPLVVEGVLVSPDLDLEHADDDLSPNDPRLVPDALIRAYALMKEGKLVATKEEADLVIAVAETRSDSEGRFRLLVPSTFK